MKKSLALKYRPQTFADMIGQNINSTVLSKMVEKNAVPHALLFSGPSGTGKTSAARILASALNPSQAEDIANGFSIDVVEVDSASNGGVADIRRMVDTLRYAASPNTTRMVIYDEAHSITREGWNALLKPTEEESGTIFVFVTTEPEKVPGTVLSRVREFEFNRVSPYDVGQRLVEVAKAEGIQIEGALLGHIAEESNGNVRSALTSLDQVWNAGITTLSDYINLRGEVDRSPDLLRAMLTSDFSAISAELEDQIAKNSNPHRVTNDLVQTLSDLLVLRAGGTTSHVGKSQQDRKELAYMVEQERIVAAMKVVWDLKTRIRASSNPASDVRLAVTLIGDVMTRGRQPAPAATRVPAPAVQMDKQKTAPKKMSLSDMMK